MRTATMFLIALIAAAALVRPALASRSDYIWLANPTPQLGQLQVNVAQARQAGVTQPMPKCQCTTCGGGSGAGPDLQPRKAGAQNHDQPKADLREDPWDF